MDRTTSLGLHRFGTEFLKVGILASKEPDCSTVAYYCLLHSLELFLKAFLRGSGWKLKDLKRIGHDLEEAYSEAESCGLSKYVVIDTSEEALIQIASDYYKDKEFEYIVTGTKRLPQIASLIEIARKLSNSLRTFCIKNRTKHATHE